MLIERTGTRLRIDWSGFYFLWILTDNLFACENEGEIMKFWDLRLNSLFNVDKKSLTLV